MSESHRLIEESLQEDEAARLAIFRFSSYHPVVSVGFFLLAIVITMLTTHPVISGIALATALITASVADGVARALRRFALLIPFILIVVAANMVFNSLGNTPIFTVGERGFTAEAALFGLSTGMLLAAMLLWFTAAHRFIRNDDLLSLTGGFLPTVSLMVSMLFKQVPDFIRRAGRAREAQLALDPTTVKVGGRTRDAVDMASVLVSWTMEDSLDTADSMRARGYGAARRSSYRDRGLKRRDIKMLSWIITGGILSLVLTISLVSSFDFYPTLSPLSFQWDYGFLAIYLLTPVFITGWGWLTWKRSE